jgi:hypothetical protein
MSIFRYSDFGRKKETPKKTKLPTQSKSIPLGTCPFCSRKGWNKKLRKCNKCGKAHTPEKEMKYQKFRPK